MMKTVNLTFLVTMLSVLAFSSLAAEAAGNHTAMMITASSRSVMSAGDRSEKVVPDNTQAYPMTSVSGRNNLHSTSVVYE